MLVECATEHCGLLVLPRGYVLEGTDVVCRAWPVPRSEAILIPVAHHEVSGNWLFRLACLIITRS